MRALGGLLCALPFPVLLFVCSIIRLQSALDFLVVSSHDVWPNGALCSSRHNLVYLVANKFEIIVGTPYRGASGIACPSLLFASLDCPVDFPSAALLLVCIGVGGSL